MSISVFQLGEVVNIICLGQFAEAFTKGRYGDLHTSHLSVAKDAGSFMHQMVTKEVNTSSYHNNVYNSTLCLNFT